MKRVIALLLFLHLTAAAAQAKRLTVPPGMEPQAPDLPATMVLLSAALLDVLPAAPPREFYDTRFRLELIAGRYQQALNSLDSLRRSMGTAASGVAAVAGIQYEAYARTLLRDTAQSSFAQRYTDNLARLYAALPESSRFLAGTYFTLDTANLRVSFERELRTVREHRKIDAAQASRLLRSYLSWDTYRRIMTPGNAFIVKEHERRYISTDTTMIRTPDGAQLSTIIVRPKNATGPIPVILVYSIYPDHGDMSAARGAADRGYAGVVVSTRGKRLSPDPIEPFEHDAADAWHAIEWISRQPWCNGRIGMYGGSYLGFAQWSALKRPHPALKTIVPQAAVGIGIDYPMLNGIFNGYMLRWIHYVTNNRLTDDASFGDEARWSGIYAKWYRSGRSFRALDSVEGHPNAIFQRWLDHPVHDRFWQGMVPYGDEFSRINIPVLSITGYFDSDQQGALYYAGEHMRRNPRAPHYLLIGPYDHSGAQFNAADSVEGYGIDPVARLRMMDIVFQWFGHTLRDEPLPAILTDRIVYQAMGTNTWKSAPDLQSMHNDSLVFYPRRSGGRLALLSTAEPASPPVRRRLPFNRNHFSSAANRVVPKDPADRDDLVFMSAPLAEPVLMNGRLEGELFVTLNRRDADLTAELFELREDGEYFRLSTFTGRASCVRDRSRRQLLEPGVETRIPIVNAEFTSKHIAKGSRIVLMLGRSNSSWAQVNAGSGKDVSEETAADRKGRLQIDWGPDTRIWLPVLREDQKHAAR